MMTVQLIAYTPQPEKVVAAAAKLCYSDSRIAGLLDGLDGEKTARFLDMLSDLGHASPIEHASFTFGIEGVSRSLLAQITRHRIASFSVQSQRYVRLDDFRYVVPPAIEAAPEAKAAFPGQYGAGRPELSGPGPQAGGGPRRPPDGRRACPRRRPAARPKKWPTRSARFVLPNACETKMVVTMNARSLCNFFRLRCCERAQWEIRALADEMLRLVYPVAPHLFRTAGPGCLEGPCPEGKMSLRPPRGRAGQVPRPAGRSRRHERPGQGPPAGDRRAGRQRQGHPGRAAGGGPGGGRPAGAAGQLPELCQRLVRPGADVPVRAVWVKARRCERLRGLHLFLRWTAMPATRPAGAGSTGRAGSSWPTGTPPPTGRTSAPSSRRSSGTVILTGCSTLNTGCWGCPPPTR